MKKLEIEREFKHSQEIRDYWASIQRNHRARKKEQSKQQGLELREYRGRKKLENTPIQNLSLY